MRKKRYILGIDEAGRGCLAGPVFVAATLFEEVYKSELIIDSKQLTPEKREIAYSIIKKDCLWYNYYYLSNIIIDSIGISKAIYLLMKQLYDDVCLFFPEIDFLAIIDGNHDPIKKQNSTCMIKADSKVLSVSAASIVAKVERDNYMKSISKEFPQFSFDIHKGYGTKKHINEIIEYGQTSIHRKSFQLSEKAIRYAKN